MSAHAEQDEEKAIAPDNEHGHGHNHMHPHFPSEMWNKLPHLPHHLRELRFPSGRIVHVASSPEEHERMKKTVSNSPEGDNIDVCLHASDEHIAAIRDLHDHHATRQEQLRREHPEIYEEIEEILDHLAHLKTELHNVTTKDMTLDASFSKYGYDARLRAKDNSPGSQSPFPRSITESSQDGREAAEQLMFWKRPVLRQYFHKGLLWRSGSSGEVASFELFVDLVYVGVIAALGDTAAEHPDGLSLLHYAITFFMALKIWTDMTNWVDWFEIDDVAQRISVVFYLITLLGFTVNIQYGFDGTYPAMVSFYLAQRIYVAIYFIWTAYLIPMARGTMLFQSFMTFIGASLWIASIHVEYPDQLALIWPAIFIDHYGGMALAAFTIRNADHYKDPDAPENTNWIHRNFNFYPAMNIEHRVERNNAFVTLVLGANILSIIFQVSSAHPPLSAFLGKAILVLIQAFSINWIYFDIDGANLHVHAIRRSAKTSVVWVQAHVTFIMGLILASGAMARLVLAHDCSNAEPESLGGSYIERSDAEIPSGLRWFYSAGLGITILSMAAISWAHTHKTLKGARVGKEIRLSIRCAIGIILICLPLAEEVTSLGLMGITCSLIVILLIIDIFGAHCQEGSQFWTGGFCDKQRNRCKYRCDNRSKSTTELERAGKESETTVHTKSVGIFSH